VKITGKLQKPLRAFPILRISESIIHVLDQLLAGRHVASRVHRIHSTAFRIYVCEGWQSSVGNVTKELGSVDKLIHGVLLRPLHQRLDLALMFA
jgi:hypothetical protein